MMMGGTVAMALTAVCSPLVFAFCSKGRGAFIFSAAWVLLVGLVLWLAYAGFGFRITENLSESLPGHFYLHRIGSSYGKGDYVAFRWHGGAGYAKGTVFIKRIVGVPGDVVRWTGKEVWVNDYKVGVAKDVSRAGLPLSHAAAGVIPPGHYFVSTPSPHSLDSRYSITGNIQGVNIIGRAYALL